MEANSAHGCSERSWKLFTCEGLLVDDDSCKLVHSRNTWGEPELIIINMQAL